MSQPRAPADQRLLLLLLAASVAAAPGRPAWALVCDVNVSPVLSISDETGDFTLTFSDFVKGTVSSTRTVTYRVEANNMAGGTVSPAVTAELASTFDIATLQGDVTSYSNLGAGNFSTLEEGQSGFVEIGTAATSLADKKPGTGHGKHCLDGNLAITWRAKLVGDTPPGSESRSLIVTLKDGN